MKEKIRIYVNDMFSAAHVPTESLGDTVEELVVNLEERFDDYIKAGMSEQEAYQKTVESIGDIREMVDAAAWEQENTQESFVNPDYAGYRYTTEAEMKETDAYEKWKKAQNGMKQVGNVLIPVFWLLVVMAYFIISFETDAWNVTWMIFLAGAVIMEVAGIIGQLLLMPYTLRINNGGKKLLASLEGRIGDAFWISVVLVYLVLSFETMAWHRTWLIFLGAAAIWILVENLFHLFGGKNLDAALALPVQGISWEQVVQVKIFSASQDICIKSNADSHELTYVGEAHIRQEGDTLTLTAARNHDLTVFLPVTFTGEVYAKTASGDIEVAPKDSLTVTGLQLVSVGGDIDVERIDCSDFVTVQSVSGDISVEYIEVFGNNAISSVSGDIDITLPPGANVTLDAKAVSGKIETERISGKRHQLHDVYGSGEDGGIVVSTVSGCIDITEM